MSSGSERDRPCGVLRQGAKVVGCICMPEATDIFIKEFNHCYGQLRLEVSAPILEPTSDFRNPSTFRLPMWFRHVWHSMNPESMNPESMNPDRTNPDRTNPEAMNPEATNPDCTNPES